MAVKTIQSVENALLVMETLASVQPIGVSALARLVDLDKNAVQRILISLGPSRSAPGTRQDCATQRDHISKCCNTTPAKPYC